MYKFNYYFLMFFIYAVAGWILEVSAVMISKRKFTNRGFLIGPYCPIYGIAAITMTIFLSKYHNDLVALFCICLFFCSFLEYITSWLMEKIFHARWWDYSERKFNLEGRICINNSILFGILGILVVSVISPKITYYLNLIPKNYLIIISTILMIIFSFDMIVSFCVVSHIKKTFSTILREDSTVEISTKVKEIIKNKTFLAKRLFRAFPNLKFPNIKIKK